MACLCLTAPCVAVQSATTYLVQRSGTYIRSSLWGQSRHAHNGLVSATDNRREDKGALAGVHDCQLLSKQGACCAVEFRPPLLYWVMIIMMGPTRGAHTILAGRGALEKGRAAPVGKYQGAVVARLDAWGRAEVAHTGPATSIPRPVITVGRVTVWRVLVTAVITAT